MHRAILLLIALGFGSSHTLKADDWPQWFGAKRDGAWHETGIIDTFPAGGPKLLWSNKEIGEGYAGPAIAGGKVFIADRVLQSGANNPANPFDVKEKVPGNERLVCLDESTGKKLWDYSYPCQYQISYAAGPRCTPTVDGKRVYLVGAMGDVSCVNVADGKLVWKKNLVTDFAAKVPVWGFAGNPLIDGENLILVGGGGNKLVLALNKITGEEVWGSQSCEGDFGYGSPVIFDLAGRRTLVVWHTRALVGLEPTTGKKIWSVPFDVKFALTAPMPKPIGSDGVFLTSFYNGSMFVTVSASGEATTVWKSKCKGETPNLTLDLNSIMPAPVVVGEYLYGICSHGELRCLKAKTGERIWATMAATRGAKTPERVAANPEPDRQIERWSNAFVIPNGERFFIFNEQGDLIIAKFSPSGYEEVSRAHIIEPTNTMARGRKVDWSHPAFANKCVFVRNDRELLCYSLAK